MSAKVAEIRDPKTLDERFAADVQLRPDFKKEAEELANDPEVMNLYHTIEASLWFRGFADVCIPSGFHLTEPQKIWIVGASARKAETIMIIWSDTHASFRIFQGKRERPLLDLQISPPIPGMPQAFKEDTFKLLDFYRRKIWAESKPVEYAKGYAYPKHTQQTSVHMLIISQRYMITEIMYPWIRPFTSLINPIHERLRKQPPPKAKALPDQSQVIQQVQFQQPKAASKPNKVEQNSQCKGNGKNIQSTMVKPASATMNLRPIAKVKCVAKSTKSTQTENHEEPEVLCLKPKATNGKAEEPNQASPSNPPVKATPVQLKGSEIDTKTGSDSENSDDKWSTIANYVK